MVIDKEDLNERLNLEIDFFPKPSNNIITVLKALKNINPSENIKLTDKYGRLWHHLKPGQNASHILGMGQNNCVKLNPFKPSVTLPKMQTGKGFATICHWEKQRAIAINEALILCSFPENWKMKGKYEEKWARLGNSVMPKFMEAIALHVKENILNG